MQAGDPKYFRKHKNLGTEGCERVAVVEVRPDCRRISSGIPKRMTLDMWWKEECGPGDVGVLIGNGNCISC